MGTLSAPVYADLRYNADTSEFYGRFLGGAERHGDDIVGTRLGEALSLRLVRGAMQGRLTAEPVGGQLKVVIYYRDPRTAAEVPVVAMGFTRRELITGAVEP
jgi:hypothetical protein